MRVFHSGRFLDVHFCGVHTPRLSEGPEEKQKREKAFIFQQNLTASAVLGFAIVAPLQEKRFQRASADGCEGHDASAAASLKKESADSCKTNQAAGHFYGRTNCV